MTEYNGLPIGGILSAKSSRKLFGKRAVLLIEKRLMFKGLLPDK